jgi:hypothetical protein
VDQSDAGIKTPSLMVSTLRYTVAFARCGNSISGRPSFRLSLLYRAYVHRIDSDSGDKNCVIYIQLQLQACDQLVKHAEKSANGEDVCAGAVEVIISNVADGEEDVFEEEMKEEPIDEACVLGSTCELRNIDEESCDPEACVNGIK